MKWILTISLMLLSSLAWATDSQTGSAETSSNKAAKYDGIEITVNVNTASAQEIASLLNGIGEKKAQDIVDYRKEHGPFKTAADLTNVKGIGDATVKKNEDRILL
ncbi:MULTISPECIES: ComEA family DNA-binding protein [Vibrio]|uniref:Transporter n=1 Tax=Vibrio alfacsensis TaxID=1074311 RepID=A0ABM6YV17_9VIBR|nr:MULTISPECIES: helix-hairpin-helix domain-containing protein [Vibrio]AXY01546.1 transporter [Vibrio alfacsensis]BBM65253.1 transporter [Vibrio alfacsensis]BCN23607.1 transporter [Vibrio alfacsensis]CAE6951455.1 COG1555 DNA uptake protein and related DNA-binding proteins [Vibrio sp. B1REV9]